MIILFFELLHVELFLASVVLLLRNLILRQSLVELLDLFGLCQRSYLCRSASNLDSATDERVHLDVANVIVLEVSMLFGCVELEDSHAFNDALVLFVVRLKTLSAQIHLQVSLWVLGDLTCKGNWAFSAE